MRENFIPLGGKIFRPSFNLNVMLNGLTHSQPQNANRRSPAMRPGLLGAEMKVESRTRIGNGPSVRRPAQAGSAGAAFSAGSASGAAPAKAVSGGGPLAAIDALLAVQEADSSGDFRGSKRRAVVRAEEILNLLDAIKMGILAGEVPGVKLSALVKAVESHRDQVADPELAEILDHVELRARVELAKFGR